MPSYIEFEKNASLPAASDIGRVVFGINDQGSISISNESGSIIGGSVITMTANAFLQTRDMGMLSPGTLYYLTEADLNNSLYGGTDIIVQALSTSSYNPKGLGKFYNPKYDQDIDGYGIWTQYTRFYVDSLNGFFDSEEPITGDGGQIGDVFASVSDYGLTFITTDSGDWTTVTSITGSNSGASASIYDVTVPTYAVDDKVIWGGYVWKSLTGTISDSWSIFELNDSDWELIPHNDTDYNIVWDEIEYDVDNDFITMRKDRANNIVTQTYYQWNYEVDDYRGIKLFQWGNEAQDWSDRGFSNNTIEGSCYVDLINFKGDQCRNNTFTNGVGFGNDIEVGTRFRSNKFDNCGFFSNFFGGDNAYVEDNEIVYSGVYSNYINGAGSMEGNKMHNSYMYDNYMVYANISYNYLEDSGIGYNQILLGDYGEITENKLHNASIEGNVLRYSYLWGNVLDSNAYINGNNLTNSSIYYNSLSNSSNINNATLDGENIANNSLTTEASIDAAISNTTNGVKRYKALLNQSGTDEPVATILENTLEGTPVWTRNGPGYYACTLNNAFTPNKTFCSAIAGPVWGQGGISCQFGINDSDKCELSCFNSVSNIDPGNDPGNDICVLIEVYP